MGDTTAEIGTAMMVVGGQPGQGSNPGMNTDYHLAHHLPQTSLVDGTDLRISMIHILLIETVIGHQGTAVSPLDWISIPTFLVTVVEGMSGHHEKIVLLVMIVADGTIERREDMTGIVGIGTLTTAAESAKRGAAADLL
jgi:hypothetical protein